MYSEFIKILLGILGLMRDIEINLKYNNCVTHVAKEAYQLKFIPLIMSYSHFSSQYIKHDILNFEPHKMTCWIENYKIT